MEQQELALTLTVAEVNVILRSLGKHPFEEIANLIAKIKQQGDSQVATLLAAQEAADGASKEA